MAHKLIIVDDERIIREGLLTIMDWESLGFEISGVFEDGREAIEYIASKPVDVVLTDIKMTFTSGIEVAKYVHEHKINTKVILLSGYKEFDLAVDAIKYGVRDYLLKPTDVDKMSRIFVELGQKLDREKEDREINTIEKERFEEALPILREQFFVDLLMGTIADKDYIYERMKLINPSVNPEKCICFTSDIIIEEYDNYIENVWYYGKNEFFNSISNFLISISGKIQYHIVFKAHECIQVFGIITEPELTEKQCIAAIGQSYEDIRNEFIQLFNLNISFKTRQVFGSIFEIVENPNTFFPEKAKSNLGEMLSNVDMNRLKEQQKLLLSNISSGNIPAVKNIFRNFLKELKYVDFRTIKNYMVEMAAIISDKLKETGIDVYEVIDGKFNYVLISAMKDIDEVEEWGNNVFSSLTEYISNAGKNQENNIISKAKEYIRENCTKDLSLEEVAEHFYLSPFHFSRIFKKYAGESYIDYLIKIKVKMAMTLLDDPRYKAYEISEMVGYKSTRYFSKIFKLHTGYKPSEYRNRVLNKAED